ncbi:MAG: hypothetical protein ACTSYI_13240 [Promethearchaeota archaeon]
MKNRIKIDDKISPSEKKQIGQGLLHYNNMLTAICLHHINFNLRMIQDRCPEIDSFENYPYLQNPPEIIVRDFIAGMTDQYFWNLAQEIDPSLSFHPEIY